MGHKTEGAPDTGAPFPDPINAIRVTTRMTADHYPPCLRRGLEKILAGGSPDAAAGTFIVEVNDDANEAGLEEVTLHCASLAQRGCAAKVEGFAKYPMKTSATFAGEDIAQLPCMHLSEAQRQ